jgi:two-component system sensor histidine kinase KdpD
VRIDDVLIEQVLINLLENATKYARAGMEIATTAHAEDATVVLELVDRGPGIPPELLDRIFEKPYRLPRDGGAGLGLAICRSVVVAHGGRIWAENREGGGAVLRFSLPIEGTPPVLVPVLEDADPDEDEDEDDRGRLSPPE